MGVTRLAGVAQASRVMVSRAITNSEEDTMRGRVGAARLSYPVESAVTGPGRVLTNARCSTQDPEGRNAVHKPFWAMVCRNRRKATCRERWGRWGRETER